MKQKRIIKESTELSLLKQYFEISGTVTETANGISVDGDVEFKESKRVKEIPVAFDKISGTFDMTNAGLENLNNFPNVINGDVFLSNNDLLMSLATAHPVDCRGTIDAKATGITDLTGFQVSNIKNLLLTSCLKLQSLDGALVNIASIVIKKCPAFRADASKYKNVGSITLELDNQTGVPITRILAFGSTRPVIKLTEIKSTPPELWKIISKYQGKGPENILDIMRDLRDAGFDEMAKI